MTIPEGIELPESADDDETDENELNHDVRELFLKIRRLREESAAMRRAAQKIRTILARVCDHFSRLERATAMISSDEFKAKLQRAVEGSMPLSGFD